MKQKDKELLLKDLTARMLYGVCVHIIYKEGEPCYGKLTPRDIQWFIDSKIENIKPYLRPMSSMTEEEKEQLAIIKSEDFQLVRQWAKNESFKETGIPCPVTCGEIDYCNKKHLDYRGLIEKGLALEAKEGMYNNEEQ